MVTSLFNKEAFNNMVFPSSEPLPLSKLTWINLILSISVRVSILYQVSLVWLVGELLE